MAIAQYLDGRPFTHPPNYLTTCPIAYFLKQTDLFLAFIVASSWVLYAPQIASSATQLKTSVDYLSNQIINKLSTLLRLR